MLNHNTEILEHEQEWTRPSTGVTYYRTIYVERSVEPDYGADADGRRGEQMAFYEISSIGNWYGPEPGIHHTGNGELTELLDLDEDDTESYNDLPTLDEICDAVEQSDEW